MADETLAAICFGIPVSRRPALGLHSRRSLSFPAVIRQHTRYIHSFPFVHSLANQSYTLGMCGVSYSFQVSPFVFINNNDFLPTYVFGYRCIDSITVSHRTSLRRLLRRKAMQTESNLRRISKYRCITFLIHRVNRRSKPERCSLSYYCYSVRT